MRSWKRIALAATAAAAVNSVASACELSCVQTVDATEITAPAPVAFRLEVSCNQGAGHWDYIAQLASSFEAPAGSLLPTGYVGSLFPIGGPGVGVEVHDGAPVVREYSVALDYETCKLQPGAVLAADGTVTLRNEVTGTVFWWGNALDCPSPTIVCRPPFVGTGATRTIGFWKTHVEALERCVAQGVDVGFGTLTLSQALGMLWANPSRYGGLQREVLLLGRQLLAASCNVSQFGAAPSDFTLAEASGAIAAGDCNAMNALAPTVDAFNNMNDNVALPSEAGPSLGVGARNMAGDPGLPAGACAP
jgi:hypothetical protein